MKWIVGSSTHGCWLGTYELPKQRLFGQVLRPGNVVFDIGGNVGFYSLLAARLVGGSGKVFTFEPVPQNIDWIEKHIQINDLRNVVVVKCAVADRTEDRTFEIGGHSTMGRLSDGGTLSVRTIALDDSLSAGELPIPDVVKMDVEGAEVDVLNGACRLLSEHHPALFVATHGTAKHEECCRILQGLGYSLVPIDAPSLESATELFASHESA